ncbi:MAG: S-layer homology domain-containing protein [Clostridia bacterium]|nr:S-layer homology domain-containing protein [Clostridia bacterium]
MKKTIKKALAVITAATMTLSLSINAFAAKFPDVTEEDYAWAIDAIETMADEGIIKGYEDGTFNPSKTVSKLEALVLISRIIGVNESENERIVESAWDIYGDVISEYELPYGNNELAYLLIKGVLSEDELEEYIDSTHRDDGLKRYEVAILLTKALDAERSLKADLAAKLEYKDTSDIPANAKKYVAYVSSVGLMQGMEDNTFAPAQSVTRAQAALVLNKLKDMTSYDYRKGIVSSVDQTTRLIKIKESEDKTLSHYITTEIITRYNGNVIGINDINVGYDATVTYKDGQLYAIDFCDALIDDVIFGAFVGSASSSAKGNMVTINVLGENDTQLNTSSKTAYKLADDCVVTFAGSPASLASIKTGSYVKLTLKKGIVTILEAQNKESKITGRVNEVILDATYKLKIEENGGEIKDYLVKSDVKVTRNGASVSAREILPGDSITATLNYGIITAVTATSKSSDKTGVIKEVIISKTPKITLTIDGVDATYYMTADADITLSGNEASFYDLRVGLATTVKLEGDTVVSLQSVIADDVLTWSGTVILVNASYGLVQMEIVDNVTGQIRTESVFVKSTASIVDYETQKSKKLSALAPGMKINVTGSMQTGVFEAGAIIIIG